MTPKRQRAGPAGGVPRYVTEAAYLLRSKLEFRAQGLTESYNLLDTRALSFEIQSV